MFVISIDVGIKNLAYCILEYDDKENKCKIMDWKVCSIAHSTSESTYITCSQTLCHMNAHLYQVIEGTNDKLYWCKKHTKENVIYPPIKLSKMTKKELCDLYKGFCKSPEQYTRKVLLQNLKQKQALPIKKKKTNTISLIDIGKHIIETLNTINICYQDLHILIENQIGPIANRMKCIQAMITQYFLMKNVHNIHFISSTQKLLCSKNTKKQNYKERKQMAIDFTSKLLEKHDMYSFFIQHSKKDDLADSLLQGIMWLKQKHKQKQKQDTIIIV